MTHAEQLEQLAHQHDDPGRPRAPARPGRRPPPGRALVGAPAHLLDHDPAVARAGTPRELHPVARARPVRRVPRSACSKAVPILQSLGLYVESKETLALSGLCSV